MATIIGPMSGLCDVISFAGLSSDLEREQRARNLSEAEMSSINPAEKSLVEVVLICSISAAE